MLKTFRQAPFLRTVLFFIAGITVQYYWNISNCAGYLTVFALSIMIMSFLPRIKQCYTQRDLFGYGFLLLSFTCAVYLTDESWKKSEWNVAGIHTYLVRVIDEPSVKTKYSILKVEIISSDSGIIKETLNKKAVIYLTKDSLSEKIIHGDCLYIRASLKKPQTSPDSDFNYPLYLRKQSYSAVAFVSNRSWQMETIDVPLNQWLYFKSLEIRKKLYNRLRVILPDQQSFSVAAALMFGYRNELDSNLRQHFSNIGAGHILAVSGLHFNLLFGFVYFLLSFIGTGKKKNIIKQLILIPLTWGFAFIAGLSPSVIRAACMLSLWGIGNAFFHKSFSLNTLAAIAFFMLLYNPLYLFNIGFQLSFMAVLSILIINPYIIGLYSSENRIITYFWELICVSFSAQAGVLPLSMYYFHQFPLMFLPTNMLLVPLAGIIMTVVPLSLFVQLVSGNQEWLFFPLRLLMLLFIKITKTLSDIPGGTISDINPTGLDTILIYVGLIVIIYMLVRKRTAS
ncbi:MAG: ComEC/Rec2 family competence protein [Dysgonamonadaceae bacterium]|jgi:competence protein ComEC|nr:ComEC/Rec2 family competence protein [Dysgonamonadaceae bacterium]